MINFKNMKESTPSPDSTGKTLPETEELEYHRLEDLISRDRSETGQARWEYHCLIAPWLNRSPLTPEDQEERARRRKELETQFPNETIEATIFVELKVQKFGANLTEQFN